MFKMFTRSKPVVDAREQLIIDEDNRKMTARSNYVEHEKALRSEAPHVINRMGAILR
jgi:hypothetical protein